MKRRSSRRFPNAAAAKGQILIRKSNRKGVQSLTRREKRPGLPGTNEGEGKEGKGGRDEREARILAPS